jgi:hypothetical protein
MGHNRAIIVPALVECGLQPYHSGVYTIIDLSDTIPPPNQRDRFVGLKQGSENYRGPQQQSGDISMGRGGWGGNAPQSGQISVGGGGIGIVDRRDQSGGINSFPSGPRLLPGISVGPSSRGRSTIIKPVQRVPAIREPIRQAQIQISPKIVGAVQAPNKITLPRVQAPLPKLDPRILNPPVIAPKKIKGPLDVLIDLIKPKPLQEKSMGLDLGALAGQVIQGATNVALARYNQPVYDIQGLNPWSDVPLNQYDLASPGGSAAVGGAMQGTCLPAGYKYDKCGNVVKTRRRRRRRLATSSDIKDLAALTAVTNPAEKKVWIATHPS